MKWPFALKPTALSGKSFNASIIAPPFPASRFIA
jgi:hypothetical protein